MLTLSAPLFAYLELTPVCNSRCPGCGNVVEEAHLPQPLTSAGWSDVLLRLGRRLHHLRLTGGEPTLHPEFAAIVQAVHDCGIPFTLFTNARWADPQAVITVLQRMPECNGLLVSLHGATRATHEDFTCVEGSFEETVTNVRCAVEAGLAVATSTVITSRNSGEIRSIIQLSRDLGAHHAVFNRYLGLPLPGIEPTDKQLCLAIQTVDVERRRAVRLRQPPVKLGNCLPQCFHPSSSGGCLAGVAYCTVDPFGRIRPCNHAPLLCGNLLEEPLEEIWHGPAMTQWRGMLETQCWACSELHRCHGGCRAVAMIRGTRCDHLMRGPIRERSPKLPQGLVLHEDACPVRRFQVYSEGFGDVLIRGNRLLPVASATQPVLDACDGTMTLRELQAVYGQRALDFVGLLVKKGLVELV